ncbi:DUF4286 family protein [Aquirufa rosea]|uniref:DUF4286 family protein n=1 Tax=Aquirufa rosea TaxID=2509241 RepID=A0A4Q1C1P7_9BACT|nr:DUF4286 family protein [Aquirufa rosea]RXK52124.1 DUF4286 family protein [Aquirufa rosea]
MIQYNLSLFFENSVEEKAVIALKKIILPEIEKQDFIQDVYLFEIQSHQEPDSKGFSLQCWLPAEFEQETSFIEGLVTRFLLKEFPNQHVYFPSQLKKL